MSEEFIVQKDKVYVKGNISYYCGNVLDRYTGDEEDVVIPDGVVSVAKHAFEGKNIRSLTFPEFFPTTDIPEMDGVDQVTKVTFNCCKSFDRLVVDRVMKIFPNLEVIEMPRAVKVKLYVINQLERWPAFRFTGQVKRIYAAIQGELPEKDEVVMFVPEVSIGYVDESYRPSLITTFLDHPDWYTEKQQKTYTEWIKKNAIRFFSLCAQKNCDTLIMRCVKKEGMRFPAATYDALIQLADERGDTALKGALIEEKTRYYDLLKLQKRQETEQMNDLDDPLRPHAMRKLWSWSTLPDKKLCITKMKEGDEGPDSSVYVPDRIGDNTVIAVSGQVFWNKQIGELIFPESVESIRGNMCNDVTTLKTVTIRGPVKSIPFFCFANCLSLTSVDIPQQGIRIGGTEDTSEQYTRLRAADQSELFNICMGAFQACRSLTSLSLSDTLLGSQAFRASGIETLKLRGTPVVPSACFEACHALKVADLVDVISIEENAFRDCVNLTDIHVSGALRGIHPTAFACCKALYTVHLHQVEEAEYVKKLFRTDTMGKEVRIRFVLEDKTEKAAGVKNSEMKGQDPSEGASWTWGESSDGTVHIDRRKPIPQNHIDDEVMTIPSSVNGKPVTVISDEAFIKARTTAIVLPQSVNCIGRRAFLRISELTSVTIPGRIRYIPENCFEDDKNLSFVELPWYDTWIGKPYIGDRKPARENSMRQPSDILVIGKSAFESCGQIKELRLKNVLLGHSAFCYSAVTRVTMYDTQIVSYRCFYGCTNMIEADLHDVTEIQYEGFADCSRLTEIHLYEGIEIINNTAFLGCHTLKYVHLHGLKYPELAKKLFDGMKRYGLGNIEYVIHEE